MTRFFEVAFKKKDNNFILDNDGNKVKWENAKIPEYSTKHSAGADFFCAEEVTIPSIWKEMFKNIFVTGKEPVQAKPTMVHTGIKVHMPEDEVLYIMNRSGGPKKGLVLANSVGVIDADYYGCDATDGEIMFAFYNFLPFEITIKVGDKIGQGMFHKMLRAENDGIVNDTERTGGFNSTGNK
jgi:dUTP pyrophosphatase